MSRPLLGGIDIGGTKIAFAVAEPQGEVIARDAFSTERDQAPDMMIKKALDGLRQLVPGNRGELTAIGLSCPGPLDFDRGEFLAPPNMPASWRRFSIRSFVEAEMGLPAKVENDANAAAIGEHLYGAGRGYTDLVYLTISTGIGGGIIADGKLVHRWSEAGHITVEPHGVQCGCGARGCLEGSCSGTAIARRAQRYLQEGRVSKMTETRQTGDVTARSVIEGVVSGDELACQVWSETVNLMAIGIGGIVTVLAPQAVILGGGVAVGAGDLLLEPLRAALRQRVRIVEQPKLLTAGLGADSALYGALALGAEIAKH